MLGTGAGEAPFLPCGRNGAIESGRPLEGEGEATGAPELTLF